MAEQTPAIKAAVEHEKRLVNIERDIAEIKDTLKKENKALREAFEYQNGRVNRLEDNYLILSQAQEDFETLQHKPLMVEMESIGDQVKVLYGEKVDKDKEEQILERRRTNQDKWLARIKSRFSMVTVLLAIIGADELATIVQGTIALVKG